MYLGYFFISCLVCFILTAIVRLAMQKLRIVDLPRQEKRKIHKKRIPLGGGLAIFLSFFIFTLVAFTKGQIGADVSSKQLIGLFIGGIILMVGGLLDDKLNLKPTQQIWFPILASLIIIAFGIGPHIITNPFGGDLALDFWQVPIDGLGTWVVLADVVVFFWLMAMMFTTKFLDGLDGLVTGMILIGALMIFFLSRQAQWFQPEVALLAIIFAGSAFGFLFWNWHPAKIFLGEGGSLFTGFLLGSLAIISGGKMATTLLVMGIPMLDVVRVIFLRIIKKKSIYVGDSEHLHFKLLNSGLSQKQAVLLFYTISLLFGLSTLFLQSSQKMVALLLLLVLMLLIGIWFSRHDIRHK